MKPYKLLAWCVCLALTTGCGTILARPFYPRTGAHGIVVDQFDHPVANCDMRADCITVSTRLFLFPSGRNYSFKADKNGRWEFYTRDADDLYIKAMLPTGYGPFWTAGDLRIRSIMSPLRDGQCPTNDVVLRVRRIEPLEQRK